MAEQNIRRKFNLRTGREERPEPMDIDQARPRRCQLCKRIGHEARECRAAMRERAEAVSLAAENRIPPWRQGRGHGRPISQRCWHCGECGHVRNRCQKYQQTLRARGTQEAPARLTNNQGNL